MPSGAIRVWMLVIVCVALGACTGEKESTMTTKDDRGYASLTPEEERVIVHKGTERPFAGTYTDFHDTGTYVCKRCGETLYRSSDKFESGCGWPSFDDEIPGAVRRIADPDGVRTEIVCNRCGGHLGHVFTGEGLTPKNIRHCVNSISLKFIPAARAQAESAIFAGGCFWGVEYHFAKAPGVTATTVGYIGGRTDSPTYEDVCSGRTRHAEAIRVTYDPSRTDYETLARLFFEIHDPTQVDGQGPDIGDQYRSEIFYVNEDQRRVAEKLIGILKSRGLAVITRVTPAGTFWDAESYHQKYYERKRSQPYCHVYTKRF